MIYAKTERLAHAIAHEYQSATGIKMDIEVAKRLAFASLQEIVKIRNEHRKDKTDEST